MEVRVMRRSVSLVMALLLCIGAWGSTALLTATPTWAKYYTTGDGEAEARFAAFSFLVGSRKTHNIAVQDDPAKYTPRGLFDLTAAGARMTDAYGNTLLTRTASENTWNEIALVAGTATTFELPLFDYEYYGLQDWYELDAYGDRVEPNVLHNEPFGNVATVKSSNFDLLTAPGVGFRNEYNEGLVKNNPNVRGPKDEYKHFTVKNESEVAVKYKLEVSSASNFGGNTYKLEMWRSKSNFTDYVPLHGHEVNAGSLPTIYTGTSMLMPGESEILYYDLWWRFSNARDQADSQLGLNAQIYLKLQAELAALESAATPDEGLIADKKAEIAGAYDAAHMKLVLKITVEQVD